MNSIRTTVKVMYQTPSAADFWTNLRGSAVAFVNANADVFRSLSRMGAPFGESIAGR
ncbi:hypothetical protein ACAW74_00685 [Fibrella sp. WM1]|uniref:hypothetical protein n=1 Tax=Fibrella musci TaxID=3242485 RepID=UPI0035229BEC